MTEWKTSHELLEYSETLAAMEERVEEIARDSADELLWLLEHPPLYTGGTSAKASDLRQPEFPVYDAGRGGQYTYHGPGQRVVYTMLNLKKRYAPAPPDVRHFVTTLEQWIINSLAEFDIIGERRTGRVGIWVVSQEGENKVAALGIKIRKGITFHGIAINVNPDLTHFSGIVPCGISQYGVTSIAALTSDVSLLDVDNALKKHCPFL